jgi:tetratricopeptide (TPR) repeat protein
VIWTTVATGKLPDKHGIGHFVAVNEKTGEQLPATSQMRGVKALWNILSDAGRQVAVVGWWATWPAEALRGAVVSDHTCYHFLFEDGFRGSDDATGIVHPPELFSEIRPLIRRPERVTGVELARFVDVEAPALERPFDFEDELAHFRWALGSAQTYRDVGLHLWTSMRPDVALVYIEAPDSTSHLFGHLFRGSGLAGELAEQQKRYGRAVEEMYRFADEIVGAFMNAMDDDTTLVVLSDHGFELGVLPDDPSKLRDMRRVSERFHRLHGILYLYGNNVKPGARLTRASILDITPTVLTLAGMPTARDMPGRVLGEGLSLEKLPVAIDSYEGGAATAAGVETPSQVDGAVLEHLRALGYLDAESPRGSRNLAAIHFQEGRLQEAAAAYEKLVEEEPRDGALRASLGGVYGAMGRYDEALDQLAEAERLEPLNPEAYYNRALIFEKRGETTRAIDEYKRGLRYDPRYAPARAALTRLTGSAAPQRPGNAAERAALRLAHEASELARKGEYEVAMKNLEEAERLAPHLPVIYQYRSNVAFLQGDRKAAVAALEKALEIEPDNALFRTNLKKLRAEEEPRG